LSDAAFYCVADSKYFLGAVGMINSLRLHGHDEPVYLLDLGLTEGQRELLAPEVELVPRPADTPPWLAKTHAPLSHPAGTMILIDTDLLVVRPLNEFAGPANEGRVVAIQNDADRFDPGWSELGLGAPRRRPYVSTGIVALSGEVGRSVLGLLDEHQRAVDHSRIFWRGNDPDYPFLYADQDVLNAILQTCAEDEDVVALDPRNAAVTPFGGLEVHDELAMSCAFPDGFEPLVVHYILPGKPWQRPTFHGPYSALLQRALTGPDLAIEVPRERIPVRLRDGLAGRLARGRYHARDRLGWGARSMIPDPVLRRLDEWRRRRAVVRR
jgi:hypothetical protein